MKKLGSGCESAVPGCGRTGSRMWKIGSGNDAGRGHCWEKLKPTADCINITVACHINFGWNPSLNQVSSKLLMLNGDIILGIGKMFIN